MSSLFQELARRNVFRVGVAYLVLSWLVLQVGSVLAPILGLPGVVLSFVVFALVLGFPMALLFAWAFELTPEGFKRSREVEADVSVRSQTGRWLNSLIFAVMGLAIVVLLVDRFVFTGAVEDVASSVDVALGDRSYDSIAVLPFVNMSDDSSQEFFSDGISEELLNLLAKTKGLRVAARTSSFAFKGQNQDIKNIGDQLDVETILEGSVRKADTRLRITAQLIDVDSGYHLWSETYDRELTDVFAIQDEISAAIVSALAVHFEGVAVEAPTSSQGNVRAYEEYLLGRERMLLRTKADIEAADEHFKLAIEIDPDYAPVWAARSDAIMLLSNQNGAYGTLPVNFAVELAQPMVEKALVLDPTLSDAHRAKGRILHDQGDLEGAIVSYTRATDLRPSSPIALMWKADALDGLNRWGAAYDAIDAAHSYDPRSAVILSNLVGLAREAGDLPKMKMAGAKAKSLGLESFRALNFIDGVIYRESGQYAKSFRALGGGEEPWKKKEGNVALAFTCLHLAHRECATNVFLAAQFWIRIFFGDFESAERDLTLLEKRFQGERFVVQQKLFLAAIKEDWLAANSILDQLADGNPYSEFGPLFDDQSNPVAFMWLRAKQELGDDEAVTKMLEAIERFIVRQENEGLEAFLPLSQAVVSLYSGDHAQAILHLREAKETHRLGWFERMSPLYTPLRGNPEFNALFDEVNAHVNAERAKLGWGPMASPAVPR